MPRRSAPAWLGTFFQALVTLTAVACSDGTGPGGPSLPGTRVLAARDYAAWTWASSSQEIVFSTPFDAPYTGPPARLEAVAVPSGARRTVVAAPSNGDHIIGYRFTVVGAHVYYEVANASYDQGDRITWSPTGQNVVGDPNGWAGAGAPLQWIDLSTGTTRVWLEPGPDIDLQATRDIGWDGESPLDYVVGADVTRYSLETGARELLAKLDVPGHAIGWSPDFSTVTVQTDECLKWSGGIFGSSCITWSIRVDRIQWRSNVRTPVLRYKGYGEIFGRSAPNAPWLAYEYRECSDACAGVYIERI